MKNVPTDYPCSRPIKGTLAAAAAFFYFPLMAFAVSTVDDPSSGLIKTDRYTLTRMVPRADQVDPLAAVINISFSPSVTTIGGALEELLDGTGYRLVHIKGEYGAPVDSILMSQSLPRTLMQMGPVSLRDALKALGGSAWSLQHNELGREVWFDVQSSYEDDSRIRRLLASIKNDEADEPAPAIDLSQRYIEFPPGKSVATAINAREQQRLDDVAALIRQRPDAIERVVVKGESQSINNHATAALAKRRAGEIANALIKRGVPADKIDERYTFQNHASANRQGVYIDLEAKPTVVSHAAPTTRSTATQTSPAKDINDTTVVQPDNIYFLYPGEDLEIALRRWAKQALYNDVVWNVRDEAGNFVRVPIRAGATFQCEFAECLRRVKEAYATAPRPLYFDIALKERNKIVYVELLHYGD